MNTEIISFRNYIGYSVIFHLFVLGLFTVKTIFFPKENITPYIPAIRVDVVDLPDKVIKTIETNQDSKQKAKQETKEKEKQEAKQEKEAPKVDLGQNQKEKIKPSPRDVVKESKKSQKAALARLKSLEAMEKFKKAEQINKAYKGQVLSTGSELKGLNKLDHHNYEKLVDHHVKQYWILPEWLAKNNYKAQVLIKLNSRGYVIEKKMRVSSGNSNYDELVMETIKKANPFPLPPRQLTDIVEIKGILLGFPE